jgi:hypothetical protein
VRPALQSREPTAVRRFLLFAEDFRSAQMPHPQCGRISTEAMVDLVHPPSSRESWAKRWKGEQIKRRNNALTGSGCKGFDGASLGLGRRADRAGEYGDAVYAHKPPALPGSTKMDLLKSTKPRHHNAHMNPAKNQKKKKKWALIASSPQCG